MLGKKRSASVFQNTTAPAEENGNQPLSSAPELTTEVGNRPEPVSERFANLQFGPGVDVLNPPDKLETTAQTAAEPETAEPIAAEPESAPIRESRPLRAHGLFFAPETEGKDFSSVLADVQEYISANYSTLITAAGEDSKAQMKRYITKYIQDKRIAVQGLSGEKLVDALYTEMAEFGFLTKYIFGTGIEEIDSATRS